MADHLPRAGGRAGGDAALVRCPGYSSMIYPTSKTGGAVAQRLGDRLLPPHIRLPADRDLLSGTAGAEVTSPTRSRPGTDLQVAHPGRRLLPDDPLLDPVWEQIDAAQIPVVIHCGSGPAPGAHTGPEPIRRVLGRFPTLPLIVAHMGIPEYVDFLELAERYDNVRLDTTMSFTTSPNRSGRSRQNSSAGSATSATRCSSAALPQHPVPVPARPRRVRAYRPRRRDWLRAVCFGNAAEAVRHRAEGTDRACVTAGPAPAKLPGTPNKPGRPSGGMMAKSSRKAHRTAIGALALLISAIGSLLAPRTPTQSHLRRPDSGYRTGPSSYTSTISPPPDRMPALDPDPLPWGFDTNRIVKQRTVTTGSVTLSAIPQLHRCRTGTTPS